MSISKPWKQVLHENRELSIENSQDYRDFQKFMDEVQKPVKTSQAKIMPNSVTPTGQDANESKSDIDNGIIDYHDLNQDIQKRLYKEKLIEEADEIVKKVQNLNVSGNRDKILKILLGVIHDLVRDGGNDLILIKHDQARTLYEQYIDIIKSIDAANDMLNSIQKKRSDALAKLTPEEKELLGIK